jgi:ribosome-binding protein aMBF1 (putative translation factor)
MATPYTDTSAALKRIDDAMKELEQRKKDLKLAAERRRKLNIYVKHNKLTRSDLHAVASTMAKLRISRKDREEREARLHAVVVKHAKPKAKRKGGKDYPAKAELVPLGRRIAELINQKGVTYSEVGKAIGMHGSMVPGWEQGRWRIRPDKLARLEKYFGTPLANLLPPLPPNKAATK